MLLLCSSSVVEFSLSDTKKVCIRLISLFKILISILYYFYCYLGVNILCEQPNIFCAQIHWANTWRFYVSFSKWQNVKIQKRLFWNEVRLHGNHRTFRKKSSLQCFLSTHETNTDKAAFISSKTLFTNMSVYWNGLKHTWYKSEVAIELM